MGRRESSQNPPSIGHTDPAEGFGNGVSKYSLGALEDEGLLTKLGRLMAEFPLEP